ncbi:protein maelstrom 2-like [Drosophila miranda]|uniref:protein maelstrom 2-like n=1 Tax=Drosophila miranda TaxID=7229 RepID=UPI00143F2048|nr:protein maelstrom 2-like [Drosophila miranda]
MSNKKRTGFMNFVDDWLSKYPGGRGAIAKDAAIAKCGKIWTKMSAEEREPYVCQAKAASKVQVEKCEMHRHIDRIICGAKNALDLQQQEYNIVAFNYFANTGSVYVPAEYATCRYSLKEGISAVYSTLIDPGQLIFGQSHQARQHSRETHKLPLPPSALGTKMGKLYKKFIDGFPEVCEGDPIIMYTPTDQIPMVKACFAYLECEADDNEAITKSILIYDIQYLLYALKKAAFGITGKPNININLHGTSTYFQQDRFEYTAGIACEYHEEIDCTSYCAKSMVKRWCYIFSDFICEDLDIRLKPGKHIPAVTKPNYHITPGEPEKPLGNDESNDWEYDPPQDRSNLSDVLEIDKLTIQ